MSADLGERESTAGTAVTWPEWRAVDKVMLAYLGAAVLLLLWQRSAIPEWGWLLPAHLLTMAGILWAVKSRSGAARIARDWYPVAYIGGCYKVMSLFITALRGPATMDQQLAVWDERLFSLSASFWADRVGHPVLAEVLQLIYASFFFGLILVFVRLRRLGDGSSARYYAFLLSLGFLTSFVGYFIVPAHGPREILQAAYLAKLTGLWTFQAIRAGLDHLEGHYCDSFPSGHTEMIILAWWSSRRISRPFFAAFTVYSAGLIFSTIYLLYHFVVDVIAGAALAGVLILCGPKLFRMLCARHEAPEGYSPPAADSK